MSIKALERHLIPLAPFLKMDGVTEICINQPEEVFVEKNGKFTRQVVDELGYGFLESLASLIAEFNNKDFPAPLLSGSLPTGERIQFVMNPACESEKLVCSIRRHQMRDMTLEQYREKGAFEGVVHHNTPSVSEEQLKKLYNDKDILSFLKLAISSRKNILISSFSRSCPTTN